MNRAAIDARLRRLEFVHDRQPENCERYEIIRVIVEPNGEGGCNGPPIVVETIAR
jgi:hypothetical protein